MLGLRGLSLDTPIQKKKHLYAVGSIISMGYQNTTIWGSGFLQPLSKVRRFFLHHPLRKLDIRAVRGPVTRQLLMETGHSCPEVYGDPGMLLPKLYNPTIDIGVNEFLIIPHFSKEEEYRKKYGDANIGTMVTNDYKRLVNQIVSAKKVISGSLHGIIIAEAYGVPTVFLRDRAAYKDFKYDDYYASTLRPDYRFALSIEEAIGMEPMPLPTNIAQLQDGLIRAFPYDLWNK